MPKDLNLVMSLNNGTRPAAHRSQVRDTDGPQLGQIFKMPLILTFRNPLRTLNGGMKILVLLVTLLALNSCNTLIGLGRDTKAGYEWTKKKMQKEETAEDAGLPVY